MVLLIFSASLVLAHSEAGHSDFSDVEPLITANVPCSELTEAQLERIGDYFMEQQHPGEQHEMMDAMMGGEGSASLKEAHIRMAEGVYCNGSVLESRGFNGASNDFTGLVLLVASFSLAFLIGWVNVKKK
ncbi:MAG: hypothetical protein GOV15_03180 [Candidatus Diapherotrites archaeon]|nr:hypothetical protein [Candidatus Diapherotrites archaeon]